MVKRLADKLSAIFSILVISIFVGCGGGGAGGKSFFEGGGSDGTAAIGTRQYQGQVFDAEAQPLAGVVVAYQQQEAVTDQNGEFSLTLPEDDTAPELTFTYQGVTASVTVDLDGKAVFVLEEDVVVQANPEQAEVGDPVVSDRTDDKDDAKHPGKDPTHPGEVPNLNTDNFWAADGGNYEFGDNNPSIEAPKAPLDEFPFTGKGDSNQTGISAGNGGVTAPQIDNVTPPAIDGNSSSVSVNGSLNTGSGAGGSIDTSGPHSTSSKR